MFDYSPQSATYSKCFVDVYLADERMENGIAGDPEGARGYLREGRYVYRTRVDANMRARFMTFVSNCLLVRYEYNRDGDLTNVINYLPMILLIIRS